MGCGDGPLSVLLRLAEPPRLVIDRADRPVSRVESPRRLTLAPTGSERHNDGPGTFLGPPRVPAGPRCVDATALEPLGNPRREGRRTSAGRFAPTSAQPCAPGQTGHVLSSARIGPSYRWTLSIDQPARLAASSAEAPARMRAWTSRGRRPPSISICSCPNRGRSWRTAARNGSSTCIRKRPPSPLASSRCSPSS